MRADKPVDDPVTSLASKTETADLFSVVWNPAFVKRSPPPLELQPAVFTPSGG